MADVIAAALGLALSGSLAMLIGWHLHACWHEGELPNRNGSALRRNERPKFFGFWFSFEALSLVGLMAVSGYCAWRLLNLMLAGTPAD